MLTPFLGATTTEAAEVDEVTLEDEFFLDLLIPLDPQLPGRLNRPLIPEPEVGGVTAMAGCGSFSSNGKLADGEAFLADDEGTDKSVIFYFYSIFLMTKITCDVSLFSYLITEGLEFYYLVPEFRSFNLFCILI